MSDQIPARVAALAAHIGDEPIKWADHEDGSITIVFCNKGKRTFEPVQPVVEADNLPALPETFPPVGADDPPALSKIIHTTLAPHASAGEQDAEAVIKTLRPKKKKEK